jgi:D-arabinose 1-dehydrogenase-like Zn-dependent alcohol dehydrogenase
MDTKVEAHYQHQSLEMQKALLLTEIGKPLSLGTRPIPTPGPGQVLVKLTATQSS